jgi:hypothetical protein
MLKIILLLLLIYLNVGCKDRNESNLSNRTVEIIYLKGSFDTFTSLKCGSLHKSKSIPIKDTILYDEKLIGRIINQVRKLNTIQNIANPCDTRIQCRITESNGDSLLLCIGEFNCLFLDGKSVESNDSLVYLIKKMSGYYNYFTKESLIYFREIKKFGIPSDYKDMRSPFHPR